MGRKHTHTHTDRGKQVRTFRWDHRLPTQKRLHGISMGSPMIVLIVASLGRQYNVGEKPTVRPFLTRKFFQEILGLEGSKISWEEKHVSRPTLMHTKNLYENGPNGECCTLRYRIDITRANQKPLLHITRTNHLAHLAVFDIVINLRRP